MFKFFKDKLKKVFKKVEKEEKEIVEPIEEPSLEKKPQEEKPKKGIFKKIKEKLTTKKISEDKFDKLFEELELILMENNVAVEVIEKIKKDLKEKLVDKPLKGKLVDLIKESLKQSVNELFDVGEIDLIKWVKDKKEKPFVICFLGINGSGKTTTIAKVAHLLKQKNLSCLLVASDTFRAGSAEQLEEHAKKLNIKVIKHNYGGDPAAVAFDGIKAAKARNVDVVLIDTAGRQHANTNLMNELGKIVRVSKPDLKIFVGEAITGNDCIEQVKKFNEIVGIDGIVLTKADVDEKGGAFVSVSYVSKKPIMYVGTGQNYSDLEKFDKEYIIKNLGF